MTRVLFIINDNAGSISGQTIERSLAEAVGHRFGDIPEDFQFWIAEDQASVKIKIESLLDTLETVVAVGGDGTVTEVASCIMPYPQLTLAIIPQGTGNRLSNNLGIPAHLKGALETLLDGKRQKIDMGLVNGQYFALMAGAGIDAEIMDNVGSTEKKWLGIWAYLFPGFLKSFFTPYAVFNIVADGKRIRYRGIGILVANAGNLLGDYFTLTPNARTDDGLLDICLIGARRRREYLPALWQVLSRQERPVEDEKTSSLSVFRKNRKTGIRHLQARKIRIESKPPLKAQADGDVIGSTPLEIELLPQALSIWVPLNQDKNQFTESVMSVMDSMTLMIRETLRI